MKRGFTLIELMMVVAIIGLMATISVPLALNYSRSAKRSEARVNLRNWAQTQQGYYGERGRFSEDIREVGFNVERGNRYHYKFGPGEGCERRDGTATPGGALHCITADVLSRGGLPTFPASGLSTVSFPDGETAPSLTGGLGISDCPNCNILGLATTNLDYEATGIDTWLVSTTSGTSTACGSSETAIAANQAFSAHNDVTCD